MNNFLVRTLTGAAFVVVMVGGIWWCFWSFAILFALITVLSLWEFYSLLEKSGEQPQKIAGVLLGALFFAGVCYANYVQLIYGVFMCFAVLFPLLGLFFFFELFRKKEDPFRNIAFSLLGVVYIAYPFAFLNAVLFRIDNMTWEKIYTPYALLGFFFLVWSNDTFAYLTGRAFGSTKFFERISPKKTWEGTIGGVICTQGIALLLAYLSAKNHYTDISLMHWMIIGGIVSITATLGDLAESLFKRSINIKDSGGILPGHGGLLDRFDGVLLSAPFVILYIILSRVIGS